VLPPSPLRSGTEFNLGISERVDFDSDQDVIEHAESKLDGLDVEVWDGPRLVVRLKSID
jgi:hypothetical protein